MRSRWILPGLLALVSTTTTTLGPDSVTTLTGTLSPSALDSPTGTYQSVTTTITLPTSPSSGTTGLGTSGTSGTGNLSDTTTTTSTASVTVLVGGQGTVTLAPNATATGSGTLISSTPTSAVPVPTNTQPCNGYVEFCARNYSNITVVAAHNSPFVRKGNLAANQAYPVTNQLNDGVRMREYSIPVTMAAPPSNRIITVQFQTHYENGTMHLCHSSCSLLDVGTLEAYLTTVVQWLQQHPYEVITILMGNSDLVPPTNFTDPITNSGLARYAYTPPKIPMGLDDWPPLSNMILSGKRAVIFMDYQANQTEIPYILDEFSQLWETPFSPTDRSFPCTVQRPPNLSQRDAANRLYMANHNLNLEVAFAGLDLLVPNTAILNETNGVSGFGSLGAMADNCTSK